MYTYHYKTSFIPWDSYLIDTKYFTGYFDTPNYHIYDEECLSHRLHDIRATLSLEEIDTRVEEELLTITNSMMQC
jgi:hypothetical protein